MSRDATIDNMTYLVSTHSVQNEKLAFAPYFKFAGMLIISSITMYIVMYLNTYLFEHAHWSLTRLYMTLLMSSAMSIVMLSFMASMLKSKLANRSIFAASLLVFGTALAGVRNQLFIHDQAWLEAMIPHHSIAILTSERADVQDQRVKALAARISETQKREIKEMEWLIQDIEKNGKLSTEAAAAQRPVPSF